MDIHRRVKDNIELLMERRGFEDVKALAKAAKVAPNTIHNAIHFRTSISIGRLDRVARALGVEAAALLSPTAMLDKAMDRDAGQLMDNYRLADAGGRKMICGVAEAQALVATLAPARPDDPTTE